MPSLDAHLLYLVLYPYSPPAGRAQSPGGPPPLNKNEAPYFLGLDIELAELGQDERAVDGLPVLVKRQVIDEQIVAVECAYSLPDVLAPASNERKQAVQARLLAAIRAEAHYDGPFLEEYTVVCLAGVAGRCLIVNLPGSTGGVKDGLAALDGVLLHAVEQIIGSDH